MDKDNINNILEKYKDIKLPKKLIRNLIENNIIKGDELDYIVFDTIKHIWLNRIYLGMQLKRFSKKDRYLIAMEADLNKLERWLYSMIFNHKNISTKILLREIEAYFKISPSRNLILLIKKIRRLVKNDKNRYNNKLNNANKIEIKK
jgi:hypothetical protein